MKIEVTCTPVFHLPLTLEDAKLLRELALAHYDWTCKTAGRSERGGFLNGWVNILTPWSEAEPPRSVSATWHEMDLTLKVLEMRRAMLHGRPEDLARADTLFRDLQRCLDRWPYIKPAATIIDTDPTITERHHG